MLKDFHVISFSPYSLSYFFYCNTRSIIPTQIFIPKFTQQQNYDKLRNVKNLKFI